jgi:hypothetical protein
MNEKTTPRYAYDEALQLILDSTSEKDLEVFADVIQEDKEGYSAREWRVLLGSFNIMCVRIIEDKEFS